MVKLWIMPTSVIIIHRPQLGNDLGTISPQYLSNDDVATLGFGFGGGGEQNYY